MKSGKIDNEDPLSVKSAETDLVADFRLWCQWALHSLYFLLCDRRLEAADM